MSSAWVPIDPVEPSSTSDRWSVTVAPLATR
jgi:hypothetical protein